MVDNMKLDNDYKTRFQSEYSSADRREQKQNEFNYM